MLVLFWTVLSWRPSFSQLRLLVQISAEMMVLSQAKTGVINVLIEQCCHCWLPAGRHGDEAAIASALRYVHVLPMRAPFFLNRSNGGAIHDELFIFFIFYFHNGVDAKDSVQRIQL